MKRNTRVLLVDDQSLFVEGLLRAFELNATDIEVVGTAANGEEAVQLADEHAPDFVLMDVRMPVMDGVEATQVIRSKHEDVQVLMLTTFDDDEYVQSAIQNGAIGYLLKDISALELIAVIRSLTSMPPNAVSAMVISPNVARKLSAESSVRKRIRKSELRELVEHYANEPLTDRELQVLELLSQEYDNHLIAETLFLGEQTVRNYVSTIYAKFNVSNRLALIRLFDEP